MRVCPEVKDGVAVHDYENCVEQTGGTDDEHPAYAQWLYLASIKRQSREGQTPPLAALAGLHVSGGKLAVDVLNMGVL